MSALYPLMPEFLRFIESRAYKHRCNRTGIIIVSKYHVNMQTVSKPSSYINTEHTWYESSFYVPHVGAPPREAQKNRRSRNQLSPAILARQLPQEVPALQDEDWTKRFFLEFSRGDALRAATETQSFASVPLRTRSLTPSLSTILPRRNSEENLQSCTASGSCAPQHPTNGHARRGLLTR